MTAALPAFALKAIRSQSSLNTFTSKQDTTRVGNGQPLQAWILQLHQLFKILETPKILWQFLGIPSLLVWSWTCRGFTFVCFYRLLVAVYSSSCCIAEKILTQDWLHYQLQGQLIRTHFTLPCVCSLCSSPYVDLRGRRSDLFSASLYNEFVQHRGCQSRPISQGNLQVHCSLWGAVIARDTAEWELYLHVQFIALY